MARLRKRTRRLLLVASLAAGGVVLLAAAYLLRQAQLDRQALAARETGHAALAAGDPRSALAAFATYVKRFERTGATAADFLAFARARQAVEEPEDRHLLQSIRLYRRALELEPDCEPAKSALLATYVATGFTSEALDLLESMLAASPRDTRLLRIRSEMLETERRFEPALADALEIARLEPHSIDGYFRVLRLKVRRGASGRETDEWVDSVVRDHPEDARFELLRATMFAQRRDDAAARASLDLALAAPAAATDPEYAILLVGALDLSGRFGESLEVLGRASGTADPRIRQEFARRLWYAGRPGEVRTAAASWDSASIAGDAELCALILLAPAEGGTPPGDAALREALARRRDAPGRAWNTLVVEAAAGPDRKRSETVAALTDAVRAVPDSALLRQALGDAYASLGESDLALAAWSAAADRAPAWSRPLLRKARALLASGRTHQAFSAARGAVARAPGDVEAISVYLDAMTTVVGPMDTQTVDSLRRSLEKAVLEDPAGAGEVLPVYVEMLSRTDRDAAERQMREVLNGGKPLSEAALLRLAEVAERGRIPLREHFLDLAESIHGVTPAVALARALGRARSTDAAAGLQVLETARVRSKTEGSVEWDLVRATYLEAVGRPEGGRTWIELADARPDDLRVQLGALASAQAWRLREDIVRVIDRVEILTGRDAVTARVARARWLLDAPDASEGNVAQAARILNEVTGAVPASVSARVLLARALEKLGNPEQAEEQLRVASEHAPENTWILLELARMAQIRQRPDAARRHVERVLRSGDLAPEQIEKAAYLLALQGDYRQGTGLLESLPLRDQMRREGMLLLAQLYARLGESARALDLCERLLESPDEASIELAAAVYASVGRAADAEAALRRLDTLPLAPSARALARARHAAAWGPPEAARRWLRAAVDAAPGDPECWTAEIAHAVATGDVAWFRSCLDDPRSVEVEAFRFLRAGRTTFEPALAEPRLRPMLLSAIAEPGRREVAETVVRSVVEEWPVPARREEVARRTRELAELHPRLLALQLLAAELCAATGDVARACAIADRSRSEFPNSAAAARQSAELLSICGRWSEALTAGIAWSDRSVHDDDASALFVAEMLLRCDRPADAVDRIEPLATAARERPDGPAAVLAVYGIALARADRTVPLTALLAELASERPAWRSAPFEVGAARLGDGKSAARWLGAAEAAAPAPTPEERLTRARAWAAAAETFGDEALVATADRAIADLRAAGTSAEIEIIAGTLAQKRGHLEAARSAYRRALELDGDAVVARNNLAMVLAELGRWEEAVAEARLAVAARPDVAELHDTLAHAWNKGGRHADAVVALTAACRLDPSAARFWLARAEALAATGDTGSALESLRRSEDLLASRREGSAELRSRATALRRTLQ